MEESDYPWNFIWDRIKRTNHDKVSHSYPTYSFDITFYITYNSNTGKVEFVNEATNQKGELSRDDFKRVFKKQFKTIDKYLESTNKHVENVPNDFYAALIIGYYFPIG